MVGGPRAPPIGLLGVLQALLCFEFRMYLQPLRVINGWELLFGAPLPGSWATGILSQVEARVLQSYALASISVPSTLAAWLLQVIYHLWA